MKTLKKILKKLREPKTLINYVLTYLSDLWFLKIINLLEQNNLYIKLFRYPKVLSFNKLYYYLRKNTFDQTLFMGKHILKFPTELWSYQEIIFEKKPDVIIETGVFLGGSTYYFAKLCQLFGNGRIIAVDAILDHADPDLKNFPNVTLIEGDTSKAETLEKIMSLILPHESVMVILDSDHSPNHVYQEMKLFSSLVTEGQYLIVEDGIIENVYPFLINQGPLQAIRKFLKENSDFIPDYFRNRFLLTHNPLGYLLRVGKNHQPEITFKTQEDIFRPFCLWLPNQNFPENIAWRKYLNQNKANDIRDGK